MSKNKVRVAIIGVGNCTSSYFFKTPTKQFKDSVCLEMTEVFIKGDGKV